jgi:CheY-like chemotaxis protein
VWCMLPRVTDSLSSMRVMVVEDDPPLRRLLARSLDRLGISSVVVDGGDAALRALQEAPFGIALIDAHLFGETGKDVVEKLKTVRPAAPKFICISGSYESPRPGADGFDGFDSKPATVEQMRDLLARWT